MKSKTTDRLGPVASAPFVIEIVVFLCGAAVMVLELVGSRLLAPYFGNSLFVWTSLIGVMLGFMAFGNFLGGRLADRYLSAKLLFWILLGASLSISVIAFTESFLLPRLAGGSALRMAAVASAVILFALPSALLGMVSPYCIRLRMHAISDSGATVGSLYAISTVGSILGTFAAGFWLIAAIGSHSIIAWLALVPLVLSLAFFAPLDLRKGAGLLVASVILLGAMFFSHASLNSFDTQYDRYFIGSDTEPGTMRRVVTLARDFGSEESAVYADTKEPYLFGYYRYFDLALKIAPEVRKTLLIGGGTFSYPRHQLEEYPESSTDVVEIDPTLVNVARAKFGLRDDPRLKIAVEDGRTYLNRANGRYDVVLIDAFKSANSIPYQLTTRESMQRCYDLLSSDGILALNAIASITGPGSKFVWAEFATLKTVFPQVEMFLVYDPAHPNVVQNVSIVASKSRSRDLMSAAKKSLPDLARRRVDTRVLPRGTRVITDDFAPVDQYLMGI